MGKIKLSTRIVSIGVLITLCFSGVSVWVHSRIRSSTYQAQTDKTKHLVQAAWGVIDYYGSLAKARKMSIDQAQEAAKQALKTLRYGKDNYFWVNDLHPRMIMHATNPALDGKDLRDYADPNGLKLFTEFVRVCKKDGQGLVNYMWPKPGSSQPESKISYVRLYEPWGWIVGTGVYVDEVEGELKTLPWLLLAATGLCGALSVLAAFGMARSISQPIRHIVKELLHAASQVTSFSSQAAAASQVVARGATDQAASLEETSASSEEITSMTQRTADSAQQVAEHMTETSSLVAEANTKLEEMIQSMSGINAASSKISKIIRVIEEIASQTNILALNAAVEAARAGQNGLGFAVVAEEVRNLARRSAQAAKDTTELIQDSIAKSGDGSIKLEQVTQAMARITESSSYVKALIDEVQQGSREQARGIEQVSKAVTQMEGVTQKNAASAEETAAASENLSSEAEMMRGTVHRLLSLVDGEAANQQRAA